MLSEAPTRLRDEIPPFARNDIVQQFLREMVAMRLADGVVMSKNNGRPWVKHPGPPCKEKAPL